MSISATIKSIQDIMRKDSGVDGDAQRISQLVWLFFLKIFDDNEKELELISEEPYRSPLPDELRWRTWAEPKDGLTGEGLLEFINGQLFPALKGLKAGQDRRARMVQQVFEDAYNYMKNGTLLRQVINKLNEVNFNRSADRHLFGDIYEQILRDLQNAGNAGEFYTPRAVTQFMVQQLAPKLGEVVLDPACGTGGFLTGALEHLYTQAKTPQERALAQSSVRGFEKKQLPYQLCVTNMLLHGVEVPDTIRHQNTLAKPYASYTPGDQVDIILTNPPFGGVEEDGIEGNFPSTFRTRETADLFLLLILLLLKPGGRAALVLPDGTLFGEGVKTRIKEKLLQECNLHTIVRLPKGVFNPYTGISTNLLFFTKGSPTTEIWYYEHPYPPGYKNYSKTKPIRLEEFAPLKAWWTDRQESELAWKVSAQTIADNNFNLDVKNPNRRDAEHTDPAELMADYQAAQAEVREVLAALRAELSQALSKPKVEA